MCFTDFGDEHYDGRDLVPRLRALQDKVLFGTDFPNLPYPFAHQVEALVRLELGDAWMRDVLWNNAASLFGVSA
jgi:predicted TIM-barrel fold metal-dependent hydrolase